jgi:tRNA-specific 2-thiouridylase
VTTVESYGDATRGGEWAAARLTVRDDVIVSADAEGLERPLEGMTMLDAAAVQGEPLAVEALAAALGPVFRARPSRGRAVVAMSGGVDSAVALRRALPNAIGVTLRLWQDPAAPDGERACCSPTAVAMARSTCHALGVPHVTLDLREGFVEAVVDPFVDAYRAGDTPNPCVRCNGAFRFDALLAFADRAGADSVWTGHYARVVEKGGRRLLARGVDREKDQSYMLATVDPDLLGRVRFPLGDQTKAETREEAARTGLAAAMRPESQEACFLGGDDYRSFLERRGLVPTPGDVVDAEGAVLGRHDGYWRFTPGQRRGLALAAQRPLYVLRTDRASNTVVVAPRGTGGILAVEVEGRLYADIARGDVKLRYRSASVPADVNATSGGFELRLDEPAEAVAPGQVAVVYASDAVVGAGVVRGVA